MTVTAELRVRVTREPETLTPPEATARSVPPTSTSNAPGAGVELPSRALLKSMVSFVPFTLAFDDTGTGPCGVLLVTATLVKLATLLPSPSCSASVAGAR